MGNLRDIQENGGIGPMVDADVVQSIVSALPMLAQERHGKDFVVIQSDVNTHAAGPFAGMKSWAVVPSQRMIDAGLRAVRAGKETMENMKKVLADCTMVFSSRSSAERVRESVMIHMIVTEIIGGHMSVEGFTVTPPPTKEGGSDA